MTSLPPGSVTEAPYLEYVDYRDELLFDPDEIEAPGGTAGFRLPGDSIVDARPTPPTAAAPSVPVTQQQQQQQQQQQTPAPYTINLMGKDDDEGDDKDHSSGIMSTWQWAVIAVAVAIVCSLVSAYFLFFKNKKKLAPGPVDPLAPYY